MNWIQWKLFFTLSMITGITRNYGIRESHETMPQGKLAKETLSKVHYATHFLLVCLSSSSSVH